MRRALLTTLIITLLGLLALAGALLAPGPAPDRLPTAAPPLEAPAGGAPGAAALDTSILPQASAPITRVLTLDLGEYVNTIAWSPDGACFAVATSDKIDLYDALSLRKLRSFQVEFFIDQLAVGLAGATVVVASHSGQVAVLDATSGAPLQSFAIHPGSGLGNRRVVLSPDGDVVAGMYLFQGESSPLELWDTRRNVLLFSRSFDPLTAEAGGAFSSDGQLFAFFEDNRRTSIIDVASGKLLGAPIEHSGEGSEPFTVFSQDKRQIFGGNGRVWHIPEQTVDEGRYEGRPLWASPDGAQVATFDGIWDVAQARQILKFPMPLISHPIRTVSFRPDGGAFLILEWTERPPQTAQTSQVDNALEHGRTWSYDLSLWLMADRPQPAALQTSVALLPTEQQQRQQRQQTDVAATETALSRLYPVQGSIDMPQGPIGGNSDDALTLVATLRVTETDQTVTEMRLAQAKGACPGVEQVEAASWQPFEPTHDFEFSFWSGHNYMMAAVQYRDAAGNLSRIYCDGTDLEGMGAGFYQSSHNSTLLIWCPAGLLFLVGSVWLRSALRGGSGRA